MSRAALPIDIKGESRSMRLVIATLATVFAVVITSPGQAGRVPRGAAADTTAEARHRLAQEELNRIGDRDTFPADSVFDLEVITGLNGRQVIVMMDEDFGGGLGVNCTYCHVPGRYSREDSAQKEITRKMVLMVDTINLKLLKAIPGLSDTNPRVNCVTCHQGHIAPPLSLDTAGRS
jgi:Photosynthetic reaction centre cytochrome C subunit